MATLPDISADLSTATATPNTTPSVFTGQALSGSPVPLSTIASTLQTLTQSKTLIYPLEIPKYYMRFEVKEYSRASLLRLGDLTNVGNIILPLPQQLIDAHNVAYGQERLGGAILGTAIDAAGRTINGLPGRETANQRAATSQIGRNAAGGLAALLSGFRNFTGIGSTPLNATRAFAGLAPNQFLTILLEGPTYKQYEFNWKFSPKNEQESEILRRINKDFNNYMSPGLALAGAVFTFPKIFQLSIMPNSKYMYKFKPAVLNGFTLNYTPGGMPSFYKARPGTGGLPAPEGIDIAMRFTELEYWLDGDYTDSSDPLDNTFRTTTTDINPVPDTPATPTPNIPGTPDNGFNSGNQSP